MIIRPDSASITIMGSPSVLLHATFEIESTVGGEALIKIASYVDRALIERLHPYSDDLRTMDRRKFEELVAELFVGFGYEVELTKRTRDGGKDIIAIRNAEVNTRFLIECKRPEPGTPIRVAAVRELYGVLEDDGASKAILATTSYFTPDALLFSEKHRWELELKDFDALRQWIAKYLGKETA
jgi:HJR/Mrr/RecB family endonuclease